MFHRRLLLVSAMVALALLTLGVQAARLTTGPDAAERRQLAEDVLKLHEVIETRRGRILDRKGRVLAHDQPGYEVAVDYRVISGQWADEKARGTARDAAGERWHEMSAEARDALVARHREPFEDQVDRLWSDLAGMGRVNREELDQRLNRIRRSVAGLSSHLYELWRLRRMQELKEDVTVDEVARPIAEQRLAHAVLRDVGEDTRLLIHSFRQSAADDPSLAAWREVEVRKPSQRRYPLETMVIELDRSTLPGPLASDEPIEVEVRGVALHVLGQMRDVWQQDFVGEHARPRFDAQHNLSGYRPGDRIGSWGIEASMEPALRGRRGLRVEHLDTKEQDVLSPVTGNNVRLTLDARLQARVRAVLSPEVGLMVSQPWHGKHGENHRGEPLTGAAVVLDVQNGEVLASVSVPGFSLQQLREEPETIFRDAERTPFLNRAVARPYNPGSTVKPLLFAAAVTEGVQGLHQHVICRGHLQEGHPNRYRCWIFKKYLAQHGPLEGPEAIARSCNIFFYTLGQKMGGSRLVEWYRNFGLGQTPQCLLPEALPGTLPDPGNMHHTDDIFMGIGQGPMDWTVLQAAAAYATLARGGVHLDPTYVIDADRPSPRQPRRLDLRGDAIEAALLGLEWSANDGSMGTTHHLSNLEGRPDIFNIEDATILAKSGTADPGKRRWIDRNVNNEVDEGEIVPVPDGADHAWTIALIRPDATGQARYAVAVVVEYAGSGGAVAGPIVNQIAHALKAEGYF
ncbi:MAG: penicillin-binding transpeptidase domain-containing protein, partial [Phycisphaeraceae bacterium]